MISLPNGCGRSEFTIIPDNWNITEESIIGDSMKDLIASFKNAISKKTADTF